MGEQDPRRAVPRTDTMLADDRLRAAASRLGPSVVRRAVSAAQELVREGRLDPGAAVEHAVAALPESAGSIEPVINATGVVVHTNLGRSPLSPAAVAAAVRAAGYSTVEFDLATGRRGRRGAEVTTALCEAVPHAEAAMVVNNGAAALLLAVTTLAAGREVVVSRGELVEIGDGFRLPDLMGATGARLVEVGTTNRTALEDYARAVGPDTGCVVKVHPSNFRLEGFTAAVPVAELASLRTPDGRPVPVVVDTGSGLLAHDAVLPEEPDAASALAAGAAVVTASGDKLLGGPQAGLVLGSAEVVERMRRHPLARALRVDKLTLAALEATLRGPEPPVTAYRRAEPAELRERAARLAERVGGRLVRHDGRVGGGGAPGVALPGWAVAVPEELAGALRNGRPPVVGRRHAGHLLLDVRCVPAEQDDVLVAAVLAATARLG